MPNASPASSNFPASTIFPFPKCLVSSGANQQIKVREVMPYANIRVHNYFTLRGGHGHKENLQLSVTEDAT